MSVSVRTAATVTAAVAAPAASTARNHASVASSARRSPAASWVPRPHVRGPLSRQHLRLESCPLTSTTPFFLAQTPTVVDSLLGVRLAPRRGPLGFAGGPLVAGSRNSLALDAAGGVVSWGWNARATLGQGAATEGGGRPARVGLGPACPPDVRFVQVAAGGWHWRAAGEWATERTSASANVMTSWSLWCKESSWSQRGKQRDA